MVFSFLKYTKRQNIELAFIEYGNGRNYE